MSHRFLTRSGFTLAFLAAAFSAGCAHSRGSEDGDEGSELQPRYHPTNEGVQRAPPCAAVSRLTVRDMRQAPGVLGQRWSEDEPKEKEPLNVDATAMAAWVKDGVDRSLGKANINTHLPDKPELRVRVTRVSLDEKTAFNSEYDALVSLEATVHRLGNPEPCWSGRTEANGHNYGRSGTPENYDETLNRALDAAIAKLIASDGFLDALCDRCPGGAGTGGL